MTGYLQTLASHVVFILVILPLVGAVLVGASRDFGREAIRRTALTNCLLSIALGIVMLVHFQVGSPPAPASAVASNTETEETAGDHEDASPGVATSGSLQMLSSIRWMGREQLVRRIRTSSDGTRESSIHREVAGPDVRIAVGVDGISLGFVLLVCLVTFAAVLAAGEHDHRHPAAFHALILLLQASLVGAFAAVDVVFFCVCMEIATLLLFLLLGGWGSTQRRSTAIRFLAVNAIAGLLVIVGLIGLSLSHAWMRSLSGSTDAPVTFATYQVLEGAQLVSVDRAIPRLRGMLAAGSAAAAGWRTVAPWLWLSLIVGFAVRSGAVPAHRWRLMADHDAPTSARMLLGVATFGLGGYGLVRFVLPVFVEQQIAVAGAISLLALLGMLLAALRMFAEPSPRVLFSLTTVALTNLALAGLFSLNSLAITGGVLILLSLIPSAACAWSLLAAVERRTDGDSTDRIFGVMARFPHLRRLMSGCVLLLAGMPGFALFAALLMTVIGLYQGSPTMGGNGFRTGLALCGVVLIAAGLIAARTRGRRMSEDCVTDGSPMTDGGADYRTGVDWVPLTATMKDSGVRSPPYREQSLMLPPRDLTLPEWCGVIPLILVAVAIGCQPQFVVDRLAGPVHRILQAYPLSAAADSAAAVPAESEHRDGLGQAETDDDHKAADGGS